MVHEWGLVGAAASALTEASGAVPLARVVFEIGPGMDSEVVDAAWTSTVAGSGLAGAEVRWEQVQDALACLSCGSEYRGSALTPCPSCGGSGLVVTAAPEIAIVEWTSEVDVGATAAATDAGRTDAGWTDAG
ncbi:MAG TPA: hydrogenase/urease maturation nickel metallochaperone HypA [Mycobacteriales bacterium]|nr:hydrogenase/urease maturation nickel metallochaperone HypA [Mycobacteriales bacterium]